MFCLIIRPDSIFQVGSSWLAQIIETINGIWQKSRFPKKYSTLWKVFYDTRIFSSKNQKMVKPDRKIMLLSYFTSSGLVLQKEAHSEIFGKNKVK